MIHLQNTMFNLTNTALAQHSRTNIVTADGKELLIVKTPTNNLFAAYVGLQPAEQVERDLLSGEKESLAAGEVRSALAQGVTQITTDQFTALAVDVGEHSVLALEDPTTMKVFQTNTATAEDISAAGFSHELSSAIAC